MMAAIKNDYSDIVLIVSINFTPRQKAPPVKTGMNGAGSGFAQANPAGKEATPVKAWSFTRNRHNHLLRNWRT
jgi:hypothetical protein